MAKGKRGSGGLRLTAEQKEALAIVIARIESGERRVALRGYAGTGKTTLVRFLCSSLPRRSSVALTAPTNKAARVLEERTGRPTATIHSLLGLRMTRDFEGGYRLERTGASEDLPDIVIVDESSMVDSTLFAHIDEAQSEGDMAVIFVGDPAQLPPVNEESGPFERIDGPELTRILRQKKGNPILELAAHVREHIDSDSVTLPGNSRYDDDTDTGVLVRANREEFLEQALQRFVADEYRRDANHCRILAWTNEQVRSFNSEVRTRILGPDAPEYTEGEWLVLDEAYRPEEDGPMLPVSSELRLRRIERAQMDGYSTWLITTEDDVELRVISAESRAAFEADLRRRRKKAAETKGKGATKAWEAYYRHRERFATVAYPFAQTVHKAQGSTFRNAFVYLPDLRRNTRSRERNRLLYTAITRPSHLLVLCR